MKNKEKSFSPPQNAKHAPLLNTQFSPKASCHQLSKQTQ